MAQLAPISIEDGKATPVTHVFSPVGKPNGADFDLLVAPPADGRPEFQEELRLKLSKNGNGSPYRAKVSMLVPVTKTVDGDTVLDFQNRVDIEFIMNPKSTTAARKDVLALIRNALSDSLITSMVEGLEHPF